MTVERTDSPLTVRHRVAIVLVLLAGCADGARLWPASGKVLFRDGRPPGGGVVELKPLGAEGRPARGAIRPDGGFSLETGGRQGARAGRYRVAVFPPLIVGHTPHGGGLAPRYARFDESGLEIEIPRGGTDALSVTVEEAD